MQTLERKKWRAWLPRGGGLARSITRSGELTFSTICSKRPRDLCFRRECCIRKRKKERNTTEDCQQSVFTPLRPSEYMLLFNAHSADVCVQACECKYPACICMLTWTAHVPTSPTLHTCVYVLGVQGGAGCLHVYKESRNTDTAETENDLNGTDRQLASLRETSME